MSQVITNPSDTPSLLSALEAVLTASGNRALLAAFQSIRGQIEWHPTATDYNSETGIIRISPISIAAYGAHSSFASALQSLFSHEYGHHHTAQVIRDNWNSSLNTSDATQVIRNHHVNEAAALAYQILNKGFFQGAAYTAEESNYTTFYSSLMEVVNRGDASLEGAFDKLVQYIADHRQANPLHLDSALNYLNDIIRARAASNPLFIDNLFGRQPPRGPGITSISVSTGGFLAYGSFSSPSSAGAPLAPMFGGTKTVIIIRDGVEIYNGPMQLPDGPLTAPDVSNLTQLSQVAGQLASGSGGSAVAGQILGGISTPVPSELTTLQLNAFLAQYSRIHNIELGIMTPSTALTKLGFTSVFNRGSMDATYGNLILGNPRAGITRSAEEEMAKFIEDLIQFIVFESSKPNYLRARPLPGNDAEAQATPELAAPSSADGKAPSSQNSPTQSPVAGMQTTRDDHPESVPEALERRMPVEFSSEAYAAALIEAMAGGAVAATGGLALRQFGAFEELGTPGFVPERMENSLPLSVPL